MSQLTWFDVNCADRLAIDAACQSLAMLGSANRTAAILSAAVAVPRESIALYVRVYGSEVAELDSGWMVELLSAVMEPGLVNDVAFAVTFERVTRDLSELVALGTVETAAEAAVVTAMFEQQCPTPVHMRLFIAAALERFETAVSLTAAQAAQSIP